MGRYDEALATAEQASDDTPELSPGQSAALSRSTYPRGDLRTDHTAGDQVVRCQGTVAPGVWGVC